MRRILAEQARVPLRNVRILRVQESDGVKVDFEISFNNNQKINEDVLSSFTWINVEIDDEDTFFPKGEEDPFVSILVSNIDYPKLSDFTYDLKIENTIDHNSEWVSGSTESQKLTFTFPTPSTTIGLLWILSIKSLATTDFTYSYELMTTIDTSVTKILNNNAPYFNMSSYSSVHDHDVDQFGFLDTIYGFLDTSASRVELPINGSYLFTDNENKWNHDVDMNAIKFSIVPYKNRKPFDAAEPLQVNINTIWLWNNSNQDPYHFLTFEIKKSEVSV